MNSVAHKTAISRNKLSTPARYLQDNQLLVGKCLDYGCGRGGDAKRLDIDSFDPYYNPIKLTKKYDTIMCNFVLNVNEDEVERNCVLDKIKSLLNDGGTAYIAVRNDKKSLNGLTSKGTWQGFIELSLNVIKKTSGFIMYSIKRV